MPHETRQIWTLMEAVTWTAAHFKEKGIDAPRLTAEILMCHCLGLDRVSLYTEYDRPLNSTERAGYKTLIQRRLQREPVAYITGKKGFWDIELAVSPNVLIPRPDTETLVETALAAMADMTIAGEDRPLRILELGTGSGAVIISLVCAMPGHSYTAVDLSAAAAAATRDNACRHHCQDALAVLNASWFDAFVSGIAFDLIISNPPYIPTADIAELTPEIRCHEPLLALDGGVDGLDAIREIVVRGVDYLVPGGMLLLETGFDQKTAVKSLVEAVSGYENFRSIRDAAGHHRVVAVKKRIER